MTNNRIYFDIRRPNKKDEYPLRVVITRNGTSAMMSLGINLKKDQWDGGQVINHPEAKILNSAIKMKIGQIEHSLLEMTVLGKLAGKSAKEVVSLLAEDLDPEKVEARKAMAIRRELSKNGFAARFLNVANGKNNPGTRQLYLDTYKKIDAYCNEIGVDISMLSFDDMKRSWIESFEQFCLRTEKQNTASRHLRDIRKVFNDAIDDGITSNYPFRKYKIKKEETKDKSFSTEELRQFFGYKSPFRGEQESIDVFKLMFCLIGINEVDLIHCAKPAKGRIQYIRRKTGKMYNIKLEPEALEIINRYSGSKLLLNVLERVPNYKTYIRRLDHDLKKAGKKPVPGKKSEGDPLRPGASSGSARTSWATIAQEDLDIPRDVIAAALGQHTIDVTTTYLRTAWRKKVDEANRRVLDWVLYNKKY